MIQTTFAPFLTFRPVYSGHSVRNPVRTWWSDQRLYRRYDAGTDLVEGCANDKYTKDSMKEVLEGTFGDVEERDLDEVDEGTQGDLDEIEAEEGNTPFLVCIVDWQTIVLVNGGDAEREPGDNDGHGYPSVSEYIAV